MVLKALQLIKALDGMSGFALPMVMISILGSVVSPELALAGLILPTLVTNGQQALRQGVSAALSSIVKFRVFMLTALIVLLISAQLIRVIPNALFLGAIGVMVIGFSLLQLMRRLYTNGIFHLDQPQLPADEGGKSADARSLVQ